MSHIIYIVCNKLFFFFVCQLEIRSSLKWLLLVMERLCIHMKTDAFPLNHSSIDFLLIPETISVSPHFGSLTEVRLFQGSDSLIVTGPVSWELLESQDSWKDLTAPKPQIPLWLIQFDFPFLLPWFVVFSPFSSFPFLKKELVSELHAGHLKRICSASLITFFSYVRILPTLPNCITTKPIRDFKNQD